MEIKVITQVFESANHLENNKFIKLLIKYYILIIYSLYYLFIKSHLIY